MLSATMFLSLFPMTYWDYVWPSTELFSNVFTVVNLFLGMIIYQSRRYTLWQCLVIGIVSCLAFHARQNAFFSVLIPVIAMWRSGPTAYARLALGLACVALGGGLCWSVILAIIFRIGDLPMYFWTVFVYPTSYAATGNVADFVQLWSHLWTSPLPMFIAVFGGLALYRRDDRWMVASLIAVGLFAASFPRRPHAHYWVCSFPYVALLIGIGIQRMSELSSRLGWTLAAAVAAVLLPAPVLQVYITRTFYNRHDDFVALAEEVDRLAPENGTLFTCGTGQFEAIQFASRLMPANTFQWTLQMNEPYVRLLPRSLEEIFADYVAHPPDMIVAPRVMLVAAAAEPEPPNLGVEAPCCERSPRATSTG